MDGIKNIIFDIGNVLLDYRWLDMIKDFGYDEEKAKEIRDFLYDDPEGSWSRYDVGKGSREEVIEAFVRKYSEEYREIFTWIMMHPEFMHVPRPKVWKKVHELKEKGYHIYLLSNYTKEFYEVHMEYADFMKDVDGTTVSYEAGVSKPNLEIYEILCRRYDLKKEECLFFDDRKENCEGAIAFGMQAIQVLSQDNLLECIKNFL